ncbi:MAG: exodeoxyribonuclease [Pseudonocardiales bacterium]|nr:exodeoxyribonuclease Xth [Pseudonocardia sp.]MDT7649644.1 exodeoxyribonuclease [Pseudonocardiales bacterium]
MRTVTSVNVNGIRAAAGKGLVRWPAGTAADVVWLQETRAQLEEVPPAMLVGWHVSYALCGSPRGRNGVAVLTREAPQPVRVGIGAAEFDEAGRYLEVDLPEITIANSRFLPHEREWLGGVSAAGWVDVVLSLHPGVDGAYSWWSYRSRAFDNDSGWRIDHDVATSGLAARAVSAVVERAPSHGERWSDHPPVTVVYAS